MVAAFLLIVSLKAEDYSFSSDKALHMGISFAIAGLTETILERNYDMTPQGLIFFSSLTAFSFGIAKETYDAHQSDNHFSSADLAYDALGAVSGSVVAYYINDTFFKDKRYSVSTQIDSQKQAVKINYKF